MNSVFSHHKSLHFALAATFTSEPFEPAFNYWMNLFGADYSLTFAPYNQVFQQLLDPNSVFSRNQDTETKAAANVLFIRLEDWPLDALELHTAEFIDAINQYLVRSPTTLLVCFCHSSPAVCIDKEMDERFSRAEQTICAAFKEHNRVQFISRQEVFSLYPVADYYDPITEKTGHIPFTPSYFTALASIIVRRYIALTRPPYKVIVLDCDNTLWEGVCAEEGLNVRVTEAHASLQEFMVRQKNQGMLLCLCSKNVEADVFAIFDQHPGMVLRREDIVSWKINWEAKSDNIRALAEELQLGLDSFIFIDDNPVEQAEVAAGAPEALSLLLPSGDTIPRFLQHAWVFDQPVVTSADRQRSQQYRENREREHFKASTASLKDFLKSLDLKIEISRPQAEHLPRLAQLTQRTNQFNSTTIRRSEQTLRELLHTRTLHALMIQLKDRFGDYGIVGLVLFTKKNNALTIDSLMLSCRALGRGVEHEILRHLASVAQASGCIYVEVAFRHTERNRPIEAFLQHLSPVNQQDKGPDRVYRYSIEQLSAINPLEAATPSLADKEEPSAGRRLSRDMQQTPYQHIASTLHDMTALTRMIHTPRLKRPRLQAEYVPPASQLEKEITTIWQEVLHIRDIGLDDGFRELGGSSLQLVQIHSKLHSTLRKELPLTTLFGLPTIRSLVDYAGQVNGSNRGESDIQERAARQKAAMARMKELRNNRR